MDASPEEKVAIFKKLAAITNDATQAGKAKGKDLFARSHPLTYSIELQRKNQLWLYFKTATAKPSATTQGHDDNGNTFEGINFASQDYLGLASSKESIDVAAQVTQEYGLHSGGAALAFGTHPFYIDFQREIAEYWGVKSVILYSTGWMAGYGIVKGMVRPWDTIIMDRLSHNCLQEGAKAATQNIHLTEHLNVQAMIDKLKELRVTQKNEQGILVITESLFSMDSDTPDLVLLQKECKKYDAILLIDMAHDLGSVGKKGLGALESQNLTDFSNVILMGSGSKSLSSNIGFVGCNDEKFIEAMRYYSPPYMFSNVISPPQCAVALHNLRTLRSDEGERLREKVMNNAVYLREQLTKKGYEVFGNPSPIVILLTGDELTSRITARLLLTNGVIVNGIEFPIVPRGKARLRLQLQAIHTKEHLDTFVEKFDESYTQAKQLVRDFMKSVKSSAKQSAKL